MSAAMTAHDHDIDASLDQPEGASMTSPGHSGEQGFSLIELLVAMVITLIVSGAIYGLLAGGQNAFRREPELTERQQNIRMSMDLIMRDVANAGVGMPAFVQVFTTGLDACAGCPNGGSTAGPSGDIRDELEMITSSGRDTEPACTTTGPTPGTTVQLVRQGVNLPAGTLVALKFGGADVWTLRRLNTDSDPSASPVNSPTNCTGQHTSLDLSPESAPTFNTSAGLCLPSQANSVLPAMGNAPGASDCIVEAVAFPRVVRYRIRNDAANVPMLERFSTENVAAGFQAIARGIEELQVQYTTLEAPTIWVDDAPIVPAAVVPPIPVANWGALTSRVRVTLAARSEALNIQGAVNDGQGGDARLRGSLTSTGAPRAILMHVAQAHPPSPYPPSPSTWYWE